MEGIDNELYTSAYVHRLLLERHYIYARLYNQGASIVLTATDLVDHDRDVGYSTEIGNSFHLDLIDLAQALAKLPKGQVDTLLRQMDGMTAETAAAYVNVRSKEGGGVAVRQRRKRAMDNLTEKMNEARE